MCQPSLNDNKTTTTQQHVPVAKGPNRKLIFILAFLKLVLNLGLLLELILSVHLCFLFGRPGTLYHVVLLCIIIFVDMVDIILVLITIMGIHVKNLGIMEIYYTFSIYIFGPIPILCFLGLYIIFRNIRALMMFIAIPTFFLSIMIQVYLNYVMKNEVLMLRSNVSL